jgi:hypothetical protein
METRKLRRDGIGVLCCALLSHSQQSNHPLREHLASSSATTAALPQPRGRRFRSNTLARSYFQASEPLHCLGITSFPPILLPYRRHYPSIHDVRSHKHAAAATGHTGSQFRARSVHSFHVMERPLRRRRLTVTNRGRAFRIYGTGFPARGSLVPVEPENGYADWGDCSV